jgi:septal ring factor EnvC (AmiA/AmiB activator)
MDLERFLVGGDSPISKHILIKGRTMFFKKQEVTKSGIERVENILRTFQDMTTELENAIDDCGTAVEKAEQKIEKLNEEVRANENAAAQAAKIKKSITDLFIK